MKDYLIESDVDKNYESNVINHNGKTNKILLNWVKDNNYKIVKLKPHAGRYGSREEVLIKNY